MAEPKIPVLRKGGRYIRSVPQGDNDEDSAAIRAAAIDYIDGWCEGDAERMVYVNSQSGRSRLVEITALELVQSTRAGAGKLPPAERRRDVTILDIFGNAAVVKVDATAWVDYLEAIKWNGRWVIVNVVWENRPKTR